jgi:hypothetical protein
MIRDGMTADHEPSDFRTDSTGEVCTLTAYRLAEFDTFLEIVPAPADRFWMDFSTGGWANRCLPLRIANQGGWHILNDCDFEAEWNGKPAVDGLRIRYRDSTPSRFVRSNFGYGIVTWNLPYLFRTPPGWNLWVRGPANLPKDGACALEGIVETDWSEASFTVNWKITRPAWRVVFRKGDPICMILPQRRGEVESVRPRIRNIESEPELHQGYRAWKDSRRGFVADMNKEIREAGENAPWQGHYTRGATVAGKPFSQHQTKLRVREFVQLEPPLRQPAAATTAGKPTGGWFQRLWSRG